MPKKRSAEEKIVHYQNKIKKLESKNRRHVVTYSEASDEEFIYDGEQNDSVATASWQNEDDLRLQSVVQEVQKPECIKHQVPQVQQSEIIPHEDPQVQQEQMEEETLDAEFLSALGDPGVEKPKYGEKIHQDLAQRWLPILRKGLTKEIKDTLTKEYLIPENCKLLRAPMLNLEISAAVAESNRGRDKKLEIKQQQLGLGITAINKAMTVLLKSDDKVKAIKILSDSCRILSDLHFTETETRTKLLCGSLDKTFVNIIEKEERDETLFGENLSEKIKAAKTIERQGLQIKKHGDHPKASTSHNSQSTIRSRFPGNWQSPSRYPSNRGGRGGQRLPSTMGRRSIIPAPAPAPQTSRRTTLTRQRVTTRR
ncbi:uncharacterized protein LOC131850119 [Achroia grisella]|uniref:uncharacterized protein LOC131850119 n=1 Tax=Achroia grisella TaxID=688607 RepID=UPI0027D26F69|nr:uncharacterized protein LOC131850119 [Achroia grisella]